MEITEVRVALRETQMRPPSPPVAAPGIGEPRAGEKRLKAYATLTFDRCFVVRNVKVIEGKSGLFVAMPSHKPKVACARCQYKNDLGGRYCAQCGTAIPRTFERPFGPAPSGKPSYEGRVGEAADNPAHRDIAHPITVEFRQYLQDRVLAAYEAELAKARSGQPSSVTEAEEPGL